MNSRLFFIATLMIVLSGACDRRPHAENLAAERKAEQERAQAERRLGELRELERRAADRETAARTAESELERKAIASERAALEREKERLSAEQANAEEAKRLAARAVAVEGRGIEEKAKPEQTLEFFYDALEPHGAWIEVEQYGYCWSPNGARNPRWRPYTDGNWAWTDYGWTWASNEPFGWATYHYGRWARVKRLGWVWIPGSEWAPAWVAWRFGDQFVGWAPLPPEAHSGAGFTAAVDSYYDIGPSSYAFVPVEMFGETTYVDRVVELQQNVTIINKTVNVTNISYKTVQNKTVVHNDGPERDAINRRSKQPVRTMQVERVTETKADGAAERRGNVLRLVAPVVKSASRPSAAPPRIKERARAQDIDRGWADINPQATQTIRMQQTREAHAAEQAERTPQKPTGDGPSVEKEASREKPRSEPGPEQTMQPNRVRPRNPVGAQLRSPGPASTPLVPGPATPHPLRSAAPGGPQQAEPVAPEPPATPRLKRAVPGKSGEKRGQKGQSEQREN